MNRMMANGWNRNRDWFQVGQIWNLSIVTVFILSLPCGIAEADRAPVLYANNFSIEKYDTHTLLTVRNPWRGAENLSFEYALVSKKSPVPDLPVEVQVVRTPVERMSVLETVYLGHVQALNLYDQLAGMPHLNYTNDQRALRQVENGYTKEIQTGNSLNIESLLMLKSDLIFTSAMGNPQIDAHPQLQRAKQPVVVTAGYMEEHPLGRSEWIKFTAVFFDKENEATEIFDRISSEYNRLANMVKRTGNRPTVVANAPFGGVWYVAGGRSYMAQAIADAGGDYVFSDDRSFGGVPKDFESVYFRAGSADFWLNPGPSRSLSSLLELDERFNRFKAFGKGGVFNNTLRVNAYGGNDIWERGTLHPEEVLADLIAIMHPKLLPKHEFVYYERLD
ncbi:MAG: ABC transporter substrate-binding protein [Opitutales bacterium]|jgi:iron complex transport system substrate-binding protein|nr:ABC transporter substrate-binding protein [Opitutales bacterium]MBT5170610.1 ABC transporter substrate-binding protein [Opitutales bacterium]MBT5813854.1 ABC transporter substrate-binding protein [Opitutales bacterium]MBT6379091.1 ABC transporter substrate-binding protein [Opitutales bacterium]MBT6767655.1 ABC transporter substrate-binding protein [Opitutales bacterium]